MIIINFLHALDELVDSAAAVPHPLMQVADVAPDLYYNNITYYIITM